jgi:hypothetical protein
MTNGLLVTPMVASAFSPHLTLRCVESFPLLRRTRLHYYTVELINLPRRALSQTRKSSRGFNKLLESRQSPLLPMSIPEVQALGAREIYLATLLSVLTLLLWMLRRAQLHQGSSAPAAKLHQGSGTHAAKLHQGSSTLAAKSQPAVCFRISNVPPMWNEAELLQAFQSSNDSFDLATSQYRLSLYPACSGSSQTAILILQCPERSWNIQSNQNKLIRREGKDIVMDRHFYGLTPLNTPEGEIVAE